MPTQKKRTQEEILEEIEENLELLINLTSLLVASEKSVTEAARALKMAGLDNKTISSVLNTTDATVRVLTANLRVKLPRKRG
jgi:3-hydroxyisobutyrate dehydrogenase-like beta-hydroxyacid dehydrogenase